MQTHKVGMAAYRLAGNTSTKLSATPFNIDHSHQFVLCSHLLTQTELKHTFILYYRKFCSWFSKLLNEKVHTFFFKMYTPVTEELAPQLRALVALVEQLAASK